SISSHARSRRLGDEMRGQSSPEAIFLRPQAWAEDVLGSAALSVVQGVLDAELRRIFVEASRQIMSHPNWSRVALFWQGLADRFDLCLATLNYDTILEKALGIGPEGQGFRRSTGHPFYRLDRHLLHEAPRLLHLHGSIAFGRCNQSQLPAGDD